MWGCRNGILRDIKISKQIEHWNKFGTKGIDQDFLGQVIYPYIRNKSMEHSEFGLRFGGEIQPFPSQRQNYEYVGDIFDENDVRHPDLWKFVQQALMWK